MAARSAAASSGVIVSGGRGIQQPVAHKSAPARTHARRATDARAERARGQTDPPGGGAAFIFRFASARSRAAQGMTMNEMISA